MWQCDEKKWFIIIVSIPYLRMLYRQSIINIWRLDGSDAPEFRGEWWDRVRVIEPTKNKKWNKYEILHYWHADSYGVVLWRDKFLAYESGYRSRDEGLTSILPGGQITLWWESVKNNTVEYSINLYIYHVYKTRRHL